MNGRDVLDIGLPCWHPDDWEMAGEFSMQDAREVDRNAARARFAEEDGEPYADVRAVKRWIRALTREEAWAESREEHEAQHPHELWLTPEDYCVWRFCSPDAPGATPWWVCFVKGQTPPPLRGKP